MTDLTPAAQALFSRPLIHTTYCYVKGGNTAPAKCVCGVTEQIAAIQAEARAAAEAELLEALGWFVSLDRAKGEPTLDHVMRAQALHRRLLAAPPTEPTLNLSNEVGPLIYDEGEQALFKAPTEPVG